MISFDRQYLFLKPLKRQAVSGTGGHKAIWAVGDPDGIVGYATAWGAVAGDSIFDHSYYVAFSPDLTPAAHAYYNG